MDLVIAFLDDWLLDAIYANTTGWARDHIGRQIVTLFHVLSFGGAVIYFLFASLSYVFLFDKRFALGIINPTSVRKDKRFLENQEWKEIWVTVKGIPVVSLLTVFPFLGELRGYSKLYDHIDGPEGWAFLLFSLVAFLLFTDMCIYWIHRWLHEIPWAYKNIHKLHHLWKVPTPFASHAFHPFDGYLQSIPYHIYVYLFPFHKISYLLMFVFVNLWTVSIHDQRGLLPPWADVFINGADHHTVHHSDFIYNYGQYFTLWDRIGGSHKLDSHQNQPKKTN